MALTSELQLSFNNDSKTSAIQITSDMGELFVQAPYDGIALNMESLTIEDRKNPSNLQGDTLIIDSAHPFRMRSLYTFEGVQLVLRKRHQNALLRLQTSE